MNLNILRELRGCAHLAACHAVGREDASPRADAPPLRTVLERYDSAALAGNMMIGVRVGHPDMPLFHMGPEGADAQDGQGETALIKAAERGDSKCIAALQDGPESLCADGSIQDDLGRTALMHLAINGSTDLVRELVKDDNWSYSDGAVSYHHNKLLDPKGVSLTDTNGNNAIELAIANGHDEIAELLRQEMRRCLQEGPASYQEHAEQALGDDPED